MAKQPNQKVLTKKHLARLERERIQRRYLMIAAGAVIVVVLGLILFGVLDQLVFKNMRPVARVDNTSISSAAFQKEVRFDRYRSIQQLISVSYDPMLLQFFGSYVTQIMSRLNSPVTLGQDVLDGLIEDVLIEREAKARGITVTEEEIDVEFEQAFGFYENGTPTPENTATPVVYSTATFSATQLALVPPTSTPEPTEVVEATATLEVTDTPEPTATTAVEGASDTGATATPAASPTIELTPTITPTATPYTRDLFDNEVSTFLENTQNINFSQEDLRDYLRRQILRRKVYEAIAAEVAPASEFIWARHILVATQEEAQQVLDRLQAGEGFADLASELSTDDSNKDSGGDLGWFTRGQMVAPFEEAAYALAITEVSQPVETSFGFHIIQLLGREERPLGADEYEQAKQDAFQTWLDDARAAANIETYDRWMDVIPTDPEVPTDIAAMLEQYLQEEE